MIAYVGDVWRATAANSNRITAALPREERTMPPYREGGKEDPCEKALSQRRAGAPCRSVR